MESRFYELFEKLDELNEKLDKMEQALPNNKLHVNTLL